MSRGLDLAAKHIEELGGPTFKYTYLDHKSGDAAAGVQAMAEIVSQGIQAKFASYTDDIGAMLSSTAENKVFTLDGGGGTSIFGQGQPYFWGTRAITPNDPMPGLFKWTKETYPDAKTVGIVQLGHRRANNNTITRTTSSPRSTPAATSSTTSTSWSRSAARTSRRCCRRSRPTSPTSCWS